MQRGLQIVQAWLDRMREHRFLILLISLLLLLGAWPLATIVPAYDAAMALCFSFVILSGLFAMKCERMLLLLAVLLGVSAIVTRWIVALAPDLLAPAAGALFPILFLAFFIVFLLRTVVLTDRITRDTIAGALSIYLLFGIVWALTYQLLDQLHPGSFYFNPDISHEGVLTRMDYLYFSFVTLATLGYGDIAPITPVTQSFAYSEAVTGVIYIAVLIARLVGALRIKDEGKG
ncbi:MAG: ion channel [Methanomicrobiales archaeon]|nr:ion channel [Methanomicrobiales archaeon]